MADYDNRKVYSPDIVPYSFEGKGWALGTFASIVVAPIRLVSRVMHNVFIMPAGLMADYAEGLLIVAGATALLGLADLLLFHKWVLLFSQLPLFPVALRLRKSAVKAEKLSKEQRIVDMDEVQVEELLETVYDELEKVIKE